MFSLLRPRSFSEVELGLLSESLKHLSAEMCLMEHIVIYRLQNLGNSVIGFNPCAMWDHTAGHQGFRRFSRQECCCANPSTTNIARQWRSPLNPASHGWSTLVQTPWACSNWPLAMSLHSCVGPLRPRGEYIYFTFSLVPLTLFFWSFSLLSLLLSTESFEGRYSIY